MFSQQGDECGNKLFMAGRIFRLVSIFADAFGALTTDIRAFKGAALAVIFSDKLLFDGVVSLARGLSAQLLAAEQSILFPPTDHSDFRWQFWGVAPCCLATLADCGDEDHATGWSEKLLNAFTERWSEAEGVGRSKSFSAGGSSWQANLARFAEDFFCINEEFFHLLSALERCQSGAPGYLLSDGDSKSDPQAVYARFRDLRRLLRESLFKCADWYQSFLKLSLEYGYGAPFRTLYSTQRNQTSPNYSVYNSFRGATVLELVQCQQVVPLCLDGGVILFPHNEGAVLCSQKGAGDQVRFNPFVANPPRALLSGQRPKWWHSLLLKARSKPVGGASQMAGGAQQPGSPIMTGASANASPPESPTGPGDDLNNGNSAGVAPIVGGPGDVRDVNSAFGSDDDGVNVAVDRVFHHTTASLRFMWDVAHEAVNGLSIGNVWGERLVAAHTKSGKFLARLLPGARSLHVDSHNWDYHALSGASECAAQLAHLLKELHSALSVYAHKNNDAGDGFGAEFLRARKTILDRVKSESARVRLPESSTKDEGATSLSNGPLSAKRHREMAEDARAELTRRTVEANGFKERLDRIHSRFEEIAGELQEANAADFRSLRIAEILSMIEDFAPHLIVWEAAVWRDRITCASSDLVKRLVTSADGAHSSGGGGLFCQAASFGEPLPGAGYFTNVDYVVKVARNLYCVLNYDELSVLRKILREAEVTAFNPADGLVTGEGAEPFVTKIDQITAHECQVMRRQLLAIGAFPSLVLMAVIVALIQSGNPSTAILANVRHLPYFWFAVAACVLCAFSSASIVLIKSFLAEDIKSFGNHRNFCALLKLETLWAHHWPLQKLRSGKVMRGQKWKFGPQELAKGFLIGAVGVPAHQNNRALHQTAYIKALVKACEWEDRYGAQRADFSFYGELLDGVEHGRAMAISIANALFSHLHVSADAKARGSACPFGDYKNTALSNALFGISLYGSAIVLEITAAVLATYDIGRVAGSNPVYVAGAATLMGACILCSVYSFRTFFVKCLANALERRRRGGYGGCGDNTEAREVLESGPDFGRDFMDERHQELRESQSEYKFPDGVDDGVVEAYRHSLETQGVCA